MIVRASGYAASPEGNDATIPKTWLITGCSRGLGRALAEAVLDAGHRLVATSRREADIADLRDRHGDRVRTAPLDVRDPVAAHNAMALAIESFGQLDVVVNNAGYGRVGAIEDTPLDEIRTEIETNLLGAIIITKAALPMMRRQGHGHFIQIGSVGGRVGVAGFAPYCAAKWGLEGFSESFAQEVAPLGIKVTLVEPGAFRTDFAAASAPIRPVRADYDAVVGEAARMQEAAIGRQPGDPDRAAQVILHLAALRSPPLRLPMGAAGLARIAESDRARLDEMDRWRDLGRATDIPDDAFDTA